MPPINRIAGIILAAGGSSRMGRPKQLLPYQGSSLIRHAIQSAIAAELSPIVVVTSEDTAMQIEISNLLILPAVNPDWQNGMGTSVRTGMKVLSAFQPLRGVVLMLADQPLVTGPVLRRLIETFSRKASGVVAAGYRETVGIPVIFGPEYFAELRMLPDDRGAEAILYRDRAILKEIPLPEAAADVDDPAVSAEVIGVVRVAKPARKSEPVA